MIAGASPPSSPLGGERGRNRRGSFFLLPPWDLTEREGEREEAAAVFAAATAAAVVSAAGPVMISVLLLLRHYDGEGAGRRR